MIKGRSASDVDSAVASFERVERLFPGNDAVPAAGFYAGEALRLVRRYEEALERYRRVSASYPSSPWAARANLAAGYCLVQADRAAAALPEVQRVRQMMPQSAEAQTALNINSILYRLHVRAPAAAGIRVQRPLHRRRARQLRRRGRHGASIRSTGCCSATTRASRVFDAAKGTLSATVTAQQALGVLPRRIEPRRVRARGQPAHRARGVDRADGAAGGAEAAASRSKKSRRWWRSRPVIASSWTRTRRR